jgi:hypothetical protein
MANRNNFHGGTGDFGYLSPSEPSQPKIKGLDNGVIKDNRRGSTDPSVSSSYGERANLDFPRMLARGENATGFSAITPNGVQKQSEGEDFNSNYRWGKGTDGQRWGKNRNYRGDMSGN